MLWRRAWSGIVRRLTGGSRPGAIHRRRRLQPLVEALEERWVPSNWFVSTLGSDGNPGTIAAPFATIQHAVNVAASGDRIHVATGVYGYIGADKLGDDARFNSPANTGTISGSFLHIHPAVVLVFDKSLQIYGGFDNGFTTWAPSTFRTYIDGGGVNRGVYVLDDNGAAGPAFNTPAGLDLEGFTIQACKATGEPGLPGGDAINAYGAGMWVNDAARPAATQGAFALKNMVFRGNLAQGNNTNDIGGSADGAALALRSVGNMTLDDVTFDTNVGLGGQGATRGGQAQGAVALDHSSLTGFPVTFFQNRANGGMGSGIGQDAAGNTADAVGGGMAVLDNSTANLSEVLALSNALRGGDAPNGHAGSAYGGTFYAESSTLRLAIADIRGGIVQGGSGYSESNLAGFGSQAGGGGVAVLNSNVTLDQVQVINNAVTGGVVGIGGAPGGGGVWITRFRSSSTLSAQIINTVVADNSISYGTSHPGPNSEGGGGGGIWLQGVDTAIVQTTVAGNHLGSNVFLGQAIILTVGNNASSLQAATATISDSIIANHTNTNGSDALDVNFAPNVVTLDHVLYANNTKDDNSDAPFNQSEPGYHGLSTVIRAADAGFTSPGAPNYDYSISASSPAVGQAVGSTAKTDIEGNPFTTPDLGAYAAPAAPRARTSVALFDPETAIWELRNSNSGGFFPDGPIFVYGTGGGHSKPIVGDWNGDGVATVGVVEVKTLDFSGKPFLTDANGKPIPVTVFELTNINGMGAQIVVPFGSFDATPVVGNWDNNAQHVDHIGVVEIQGGVAVWKLRNSFSRGAPDITLAYGGVTSIPMVGDWNGDGVTTVGVVENVGGVLTWKLRNSFTPGTPDFTFAYGLATAVPVVGDWDNNRTFTPGISDFTSGLWQLRNENSGGPADAGTFTFGPSGGSDALAERWLPLAGDFDGLG